MFVAIDGEVLRVEGTIHRVTLHVALGLNLLNGTMTQDHVRTNGEITIELGSLWRVESETEPDEYEIGSVDGEVIRITSLPSIPLKDDDEIQP
jgi:hypothetical protein